MELGSPMKDEQIISRKRILGATMMVVIAILLSKISGLARDQIMAGFFGLNYDVDAFIWARYIPNLFRVLIAESLIVAAFVPIYTVYIKKKKELDSRIFVSSITNIMLIAFLFISGIFFILSPQIGSLFSIITESQMNHRENACDIINKAIAQRAVMSTTIAL